METSNSDMNSVEGAALDVVPAKYEEYSKKYTEDRIKKAVNSFEFDENSRETIKGIALWVLSACESLTNTFTQDELNVFVLRVSKMSEKYQENKQLLTNIETWSRCRKNVIKTLKSGANKLDQNSRVTNLGCFIGSVVGLYNSLELGIFQNISQKLVEYTGGISPTFGLVTESAFLLAPHFGYLGLMSCFGELVMSKSILSGILKAVKEDIDAFEPLQKWYNETDDLDASTKALFPYGIDLKIVKSISKSLPTLDTHLKVFTSIFISNVKSNQDLFRDGIFVSKVSLFCRSEAAKEWYNRIMEREHPVYLEGAKIFFRNEMRELARMSPDSVSTLEISKIFVKQSSVPRFIDAGLNGMSLYSAFKDLRDGSNHSSSDMLREMAKKAASFLAIMEKVRIKIGN